ncbi:hypothetical protein IV454_09645 [Massilia antarctica]|uniref:DUF4352 domain-containing protein n=1 Tax=Massilia antarctica TaxID=2765360 RepID=A0AA48WIB6_9BURK|nr:hypothetical protein [Massilia antarctica]QPI51730.1 hypothetical protein IV454_09645 [Massilia antarctica]
MRYAGLGPPVSTRPSSIWKNGFYEEVAKFHGICKLIFLLFKSNCAPGKIFDCKEFSTKSANRSRNLLTAIFNTVIGTLAVAGVWWIIKSRWLYVIAPKLYMTTSRNGEQIHSLSIYNAGLLLEEEVTMIIRPVCRFEIVGTSKSTVTVQGNIITIPKLIRLETVTLLLLVQGRQFEHADIESIESKATHGKVVANKENATAVWQSILVIPLLTIFLVVPFLLGTFVGSEMKQSMFGYIAEKYELIGSSKQLAGFKNTTNIRFGHGKLEKDFKESRVKITVQEVIRRGDVLTLMVDIKNSTGSAIIIDGSMNGTAGKGTVDYQNSRTESFALAEGANKTIKFQVFLPEITSVKMIEGNYSFKTFDGDDLTVVQILQFD